MKNETQKFYFGSFCPGGFVWGLFVGRLCPGDFGPAGFCPRTIVVTCSFWGEFELDLYIIRLKFITNIIINYVTGLVETKNVHKTSLSLNIIRISFLMLQNGEEKNG